MLCCKTLKQKKKNLKTRKYRPWGSIRNMEQNIWNRYIYISNDFNRNDF